MKKVALVLLLLLFIGFSPNSFAHDLDISVQNDITSTNKNNYPTAKVTNHKDVDIVISWSAYGDEFQDDILVPANSTISLGFPQLSFLGNNHETTEISFTWNKDDLLNSQNVDLITVPFDALKKNTSPKELG